MTSKIKVDNINKVSDDSNIIKKCGSTITMGSGACNPIVVDGSAVTIGRCGGTVALASGASQTGFGRTGTVDWQTGSIKTATFTATNGEGYFCNTGGGAFEVDLPAGSAGAIVSIQDYNNTFDSYSLTVDPNGSEKINGGTAGAPVVLSTEGLGITFVYIDATVGWRSVQSNEYAAAGEAFLTATGGTISTAPDGYRLHTFTGPGTFCVSALATNPSNNLVDYLVIGGGAGGGGFGGGGGAGGFRASSATYTSTPMPAHPLVNGVCGVTASVQGYPIVVGAGGAGNPACNPPYQQGNAGNTSSGVGISSAGGGGGGKYGNPTGSAGSGGASGGGGGTSEGPSHNSGGGGNSPPVSPAQGNSGGQGGARDGGGPYEGAGGGGGALASGSNFSGESGGGGGNGAGFAGVFGPGNGQCSGSSQYFSGGGGGRGQASGWGGDGGIGGGQKGGGPSGNNGGAGTANTGGASGGSASTLSCAGGSGIVVIRYKIS